MAFNDILCLNVGGTRNKDFLYKNCLKILLIDKYLIILKYNFSSHVSIINFLQNLSLVSSYHSLKLSIEYSYNINNSALNLIKLFFIKSVKPLLGLRHLDGL